MKKIIACLFIFCIILNVCACSVKPNMEELLSYQRSGSKYSLRITDGEVFYADLEIAEKEIRLIFTDEKREGLSYRLMDDGEISLFFEETEIPLASSELIKCQRWFAAFSVSAGENIWKIKKETFGGISVYVCKDGIFTLYIDAVSNLPLKIESERMTIDILACETVEK